MALVGTNVKLEIQKTAAAGVAITGISKAASAVVTHGGADPSVGDIMIISATGMVEIDGQAAKVTAISAGVSFTLGGLDTTEYSDFVAGTFQRVTAWETVSNATNVSAPPQAPNELDATTLIDKTAQTEFGIPAAVTGSVATLYNPALGGMVEIKEATLKQQQRALRITFAGGENIVLNAKISGGQGFDIGQNALVTSSFSFSQVRENLYYAT
jgi:hypothetical protein